MATSDAVPWFSYITGFVEENENRGRCVGLGCVGLWAAWRRWEAAGESEGAFFIRSVPHEHLVDYVIRSREISALWTEPSVSHSAHRQPVLELSS